MTIERRPAASRTVNWDVWTSVAFGVLGVALIANAMTFPRGVRGVPGPAFFPIALGAILLVLSAAVGFGATRHPAVPYWDRTGREPIFGRMTLLMLLLVTYVALWTFVPFVIRTPLLLIAVYRLFRESWIRAVVIAAMLTAALFGIFEGLLSIQL
jgi:hypothetical protein